MKSLLMPTPVSDTSRCRIDDFSFIGFCVARSFTLPPVFVNLLALDSRLLSIFRSESSSPRTLGQLSPSVSITNLTPFVLIMAL